jgi:branched-chain amino acid transport system ATP-binding protein
MELTMHPLLEIADLEAGYMPGINVLKDVGLTVCSGEIVALLGRNGAGKSTLIRCVGGHLRPFSGTVRFAGVDLSGSEPDVVVKSGIATVPEGRRVFGSLSVQENLAVGMFSRRAGIKVNADLSRIYELFPRLAERRSQLAGTLSGGEQQMVAMGRALMAEPKMLLLDEPSMGLAPMMIEAVFDMINRLAQDGVTILLVEQNAVAALDIADRAYVLERGRVVQSGLAEDIESRSEIQSHYLGVEQH